VDVFPTIREELELPAARNDTGNIDGDAVDGAAVDGVAPGRSLLSLWDNPEQPVRRYAAAEMNYHVAYDPARSVFDGRYHLVRHHGDARVVAPNISDSPVKDLVLSGGRGAPLSPLMVPPREGLYDLWFDPLQNTNVLAEPGVTGDEVLPGLQPPVDRLRSVLDRWMVATDDPLLAGAVPAPAGAAVAPRDAYSSTTADVMIAERKETRP
jgi:N-sulfoglucosamine sulfohydrolase